MPNVLVTGGTGFVGFWMNETKPDGFTLDRLNRHDFYSQMAQWFSDRYYGKHYDYVVHLAPAPPWGVIKVARHNHCRLLYCSSGIIYHEENDTEYRRNKIAWEAECLASGVDVVIARLFTFCGEHLSADHAIVAFEQAAKRGEPLRIWGKGDCIRSYMHGEEMGRWMWAVLLKGASGEAYDVGSDEPVTMLELAKRYSDNIIIEGGRDAMPCYLPPNTAKTKALLDNHSSV